MSLCTKTRPLRSKAPDAEVLWYEKWPKGKTTNDYLTVKHFLVLTNRRLFQQNQKWFLQLLSLLYYWIFHCLSLAWLCDSDHFSGSFCSRNRPDVDFWIIFSVLAWTIEFSMFSDSCTHPTYGIKCGCVPQLPLTFKLAIWHSHPLYILLARPREVGKEPTFLALFVYTRALWTPSGEEFTHLNPPTALHRGIQRLFKSNNSQNLIAAVPLFIFYLHKVKSWWLMTLPFLTFIHVTCRKLVIIKVNCAIVLFTAILKVSVIFPFKHGSALPKIRAPGYPDT